MDRSHHQKPVKSEPDRIRTGRRKAGDMESPRDKTVCFMVSETEKSQIDLVGVGIKRTRSALLAKVVSTFVEGVMTDGDWQKYADEMANYMSECRDGISNSNHPLIKKRK